MPMLRRRNRERRFLRIEYDFIDMVVCLADLVVATITSAIDESCS